MDAPLIFVVDDNADACELAGFLLASYGWQTRAFQDGRSCIEAALQQAPACILSDLQMPVMDGLQLIESLRAAGLQVPVVIMTASPGDSPPVLHAASRAAGLVSKPYEAELLNDMLSRAIATARAATPPPATH
jgi:FixJ family two-component response regulator